MNELKKSHINSLVTQYHASKDEAQLEVIYRSLRAEYNAKLNHWSATTTFLSGEHDVQALFDDAFTSVLQTIEANDGDFVKLFHLRLTSRFNSLLRKVNVRRRHELYETDNGDEDAANIEIASDFSTEDYVIERMTAKQKADQRQLISDLVCGENARTTAIVQAYLTTDLKTPTAIGKHLGLDHKQVSRALNRLAGKFETKQYGNYRDYLVAL